MVPLVWSFAVLLALLALVLLFLALRGSLWPAGACPRCKYDRSGLPTSASPACPECGCSRPPLAHARRRGRWKLLPALVLLLPLAALIFPAATTRALRFVTPYWSLTRDTTAQGVRVRVYTECRLPNSLIIALDKFHIDADWLPTPGGRVLVTTPSGGTLLDAQGYRADVEAGPAAFAPTTLTQDDLDADGVPDLAVMRADDGNVNSPELVLLRLGPTPALITTARGMGFYGLSPLQGGGMLIRFDDHIWRYWAACGACSPHAPVQAAFLHGRVLLAAQQMYAPLPPAPALDAMAAAMTKTIRAQAPNLANFNTDDMYDAFWGDPITLIYSGHEPEAFDLINRAWPSDLPGKDRFLTAFEHNLSQSLWHPALQAAFNTNTPPTQPGPELTFPKPAN